MFVRFVFIMMCFVVAIENVCAQPNQYIQDVAADFEAKIKNTEQVKLDSESANYIKRLSKFSDSAKYELKTLYFTEQTFWQLYDDLSAKVHKKSEETGRKVKNKEKYDEQTGERYMYVGLDLGEYEDCELTLCESSYPDDIEMCSLDMRYTDVADDIFSASLAFYCDNKKENRTNKISFLVNANGNLTSDNEKHVLSHVLLVSIGGSEEKYDEVYRQKNESLAIRRANQAEMQQNKKNAVLGTEPELPGSEVFSVTFTSVRNQM